MRTILAAVAACGLLGACGGGASTSNHPTALASAMDDCQQGQDAVKTALQSTDSAAAAKVLSAAAASCHLAANELRKTPLAGYDPVATPTAVDRLADGIGEIGQALQETSTDKAHAEAQEGMSIYQDGLTKLGAAKTS